MQAELWRQVEDLFHGARALAPEERRAFLERACGGNVLLESEVQTLLDHFEEASAFLETSPVAKNMAARSPTETLLTGQVVGSFEIVELIGRGGMGEVYRARDTRLKRDVAVKVLPSYLSTDADALCRFELEAQAAGRLNHPNIVAVYDIGMHEGAPYLVSELLDGESLRSRLAKGRLPLETAVDYANQIAGGLAAAHEQGITHRDIKPENLFITRDGRVKILDFGLATGPEARDERQAGLGRAIGTAPYMSPEQARGEPTDHRSDVFSFGCVLHEMVTGERPFQGNSSISIIAAILKAQPKPARKMAPGAPRDVERIIERCLSKEVEQRCQSMAEIGVMLQKIASGGRRRRRVFAYALATLFVSALVAGGLHFYRGRSVTSHSNSEWVPLTDLADSATQPSLSPDGQMLTFIRGPDTFMSSGEIYVKRLPNGDARQVTSDGKTKMSPIFSPNGSEIAYTVPFSWDTWIVPAWGGQPRLLLRNASGLTWIGARNVLFSEIDHGSHMFVVTATESRSDERKVYVPHDALGMAHRSYLSPDRRSVLIAEMTRGWLPCRLVPFDGRSPGKAVGPLNAACTSAAWSPDGRWMFFSSNAGSGFHIWRQRFPDGQPEQITSGPTEEEGVAISRDGRSLVTSVGLTQGTVWLHDAGGDRQISSEGYAFLPELDWNLGHSVFSPDGKKLYYAVKRGTWPGTVSELWMADLTTGHNQRVLPSFQSASYDISPNGERVVFSVVDAENKSRIWLAPLNSHAPPHRIPSTSESDIRPIYAADGELFFETKESGDYFIYRMREDGTERRKVIPNPIIQLQSVSPDGEWVVAQTAVSGEERTRAVVAYSTRDGSRRRICNGLCWAVWSQDGTIFNLTLSGKGASFAIPLRRGETFPSLLGTSGIKSEGDLRALEGVQAMDWADSLSPYRRNVYFVPHSASYAFYRETVRRNIYRIPIP